MCVSLSENWSGALKYTAGTRWKHAETSEEAVPRNMGGEEIERGAAVLLLSPLLLLLLLSLEEEGGGAGSPLERMRLLAAKVSRLSGLVKYEVSAARAGWAYSDMT